MSRRQRVYGVTKCMECHKAFQPDDVIRETVREDHPWRATSVPGYMVRSASTVGVVTKWHAECLAEVEQWAEKVRQDDEAQRLALVETLRAAMNGGAA